MARRNGQMMGAGESQVSAEVAETVEVVELKWPELRKVAKQAGINTRGMNRADIEAALQAVAK